MLSGKCYDYFHFILIIHVKHHFIQTILIIKIAFYRMNTYLPIHSFSDLSVVR